MEAPGTVTAHNLVESSPSRALITGVILNNSIVVGGLPREPTSIYWGGVSALDMIQVFGSKDIGSHPRILVVWLRPVV